MTVMRYQCKNSLSICYLVTSLNYGGAESVVIKLAIEMRHRGWQVRIISMLQPDVDVKELDNSGIEIVTLKMNRGIPDPLALFRLTNLLKKWKPLVLHSHMVHANLLGRTVRLFYHVPVQISTAHNIDEGPRWREIAYRITDYLSDVTTNVSQAAVDQYIKVGATPKHKIRYIPNGLDTTTFCRDETSRESLRKVLDLEDKFVWLAVGRLTEAKDYPNMLRAYSQIPKAVATQLLIIGQGELKDKLSKEMDALNINDRVTLMGVRHDIPQIMNAADAYIMSSAWEGLPMVLLEAAASGLPIVATDIGGNKEIVQDGKSGFIVSPGKPDELLQAMQAVMQLPLDARQEMGKRGRDYVQENYSKEHVADMWENLYREFIALRCNTV